MTSRTRTEILLYEEQPYSCQSYYGSHGDCVMAPGAATTPFSFYSKTGKGVRHKYRTMDDVLTPNFHELRAQGMIINNPMKSLMMEEFNPVGELDINWISQKWGCLPLRWFDFQLGRICGTVSCNALAGGYMESTYDSTSLTDQAMSKAWSKIGEAEILALVSLAEFQDCVDGFADILKKVIRIYKALKRHQYRKLKKEISPKELADIYMNMRYNLRPTYYDAIGLLKAIKKKLIDVPRRQTYRAQLSDKRSYYDYQDLILMGTSGWRVYTTVKKTVDIEVVARAGVLANLDLLMKSQFFGFDQIADSVWDYIPLSFVIDWFFNVGNIISSFSPDYGVNVLASWIVLQKTTIQTNSISGLSWYGTEYGGYKYIGRGVSLPNMTSYKITTTKERTPNYARPIIPRFRLKLDVLKLIDLGIIGKNLFKSSL